MGMSFMLSPGVTVKEWDLTTIIPQVATSGAALVGGFSWGPLEKYSYVTTEDDLVRIYGKPSDNNFGYWFAAKNFLDYSRNLKILRVVGEGAQNSYDDTATPADTILIANINDWQDNFSAPSANDFGQFAGRYPGVLADGIEIHMADEDTFSAVQTVTITNAGSGYTTADDHGATVTFTAPFDGGVTATGTLVVEADVVTGITITDGGKGYRNPPEVTIPAPADVIANATLIVAADVVVGVTITDPGFGYTGVETVTFPAPVGGGTTATGTLVVVNGEVTDITITDPGSGYTTVDDDEAIITIASPTTGGITATATASLWAYYDQFLTIPKTTAYTEGKSGSNDGLHIVIVDGLGSVTGTKGEILERYAFCSKAKDATYDDGTSSYYPYVLRDRSRYVWFGEFPPGMESGTGAWGNLAQDRTFESLTAPVAVTLDNGADGSNPSNNELIPGWNYFKNVEEIDIGLCITGPADRVLQNHVIQNVAEYRRDCIAFISPEAPNSGGVGTGVINAVDYEIDNLLKQRNVLPSSSFGVFDCNWKYQFDTYNDTFRWVPLNGDIAGLCARTDETTDPWYSPAGYNRGSIKNVVKLAWNPNRTARDELYPNSINPVVSEFGEGTILFGDRTMLTQPSAFDRINVRRLFIVLEKAIAKAAKYLLFEFNDTFTRLRFKQMVEPYLRDVQGRRGIYDFQVVCDETNNTPYVIDNNAFVGDIYIKPARSINFITLNFVATGTGVVFDEIIGQFG